MIKPCDILLSVVVGKLEMKWESGGKVSPGYASGFCPLFLSPQHIKELCSPTCLVSGLSCNSSLSLSHPSSASLHIVFTCSLSLTRKCTETQLLPQGWMLDVNMDRMQRFSKPGFVWSVDVYTYVQRERMHGRCGSLRPRVSGRRILLVSARGNTSLILSAQVSVCLRSPLHSSGPYPLPPRPFSRSCSHVLDELSQGFSTSSSFVLSEVCLGKQGLSVWLVRTVGVLRERLGHVGASNSAELQQRPALSWVLEWPNGGLIACCMLRVMFAWSHASVVLLNNPSLRPHILHYCWLAWRVQFFTLVTWTCQPESLINHSFLFFLFFFLLRKLSLHMRVKLCNDFIDCRWILWTILFKKYILNNILLAALTTFPRWCPARAACLAGVAVMMSAFISPQLHINTYWGRLGNMSSASKWDA